MSRTDNVRDLFNLDGRVAAVSGGYGVLGGVLASSLAAAGCKVAVIGRKTAAADEKVSHIRENGGVAMADVADVLDEAAIQAGCEAIGRAWGHVDILINAAGGNVPAARNDNRSVFEVPMGAFDEVMRLNLHGTVVPTMVFGRAMADRGSGCIVNISSMAATQS